MRAINLIDAFDIFRRYLDLIPNVNRMFECLLLRYGGVYLQACAVRSG